MNKLTIKQKQVIINRLFIPGVVVVFALILTIGYFIVLQAPYQRLSDTKTSAWPAVEQRINRLKSEINMFRTGTLPGSAFTAEEQRLLAQVLPGAVDITSVTVQLTTLAKEFNFVVTGVSVATNGAATQPAGDGTGQSRFKPATIKVGVSGGTYYDFKNLLRALETSVMIFDVQQITFSGDATDFELELSTYYYQAPATAAQAN